MRSISYKVWSTGVHSISTDKRVLFKAFHYHCNFDENLAKNQKGTYTYTWNVQ